MVLRGHFLSNDTKGSYSAMILAVSPSLEHSAATMNTLKYGNLVGVAGVDKKRTRAWNKGTFSIVVTITNIMAMQLVQQELYSITNTSSQ